MNGFLRLTKLDPGSHGVAADRLALVILLSSSRLSPTASPPPPGKPSMNWPPTLSRPYSIIHPVAVDKMDQI